MKRQSKFAVAGITGAMLIGAGAGVVLNLPAGAGASSGTSSAATATTTGTTDDTSGPTDPVPADSGTTAGETAGEKGPRGDFLKSQLDALVTAGTITQAQEDAILAGIEANRPTPATGDHAGGPGMGGRPGGGGPKGGGRGPGMGGGRGFGLAGGIDAAATALGITTDELKTDLEGGKTIADVATDKGVDVQKVIDAIVAAETADITERVTDAVNGVKPTPPADAPTDAPAPSDDTTATTTG